MFWGDDLFEDLALDEFLPLWMLFWKQTENDTDETKPNHYHIRRRPRVRPDLSMLLAPKKE